MPVPGPAVCGARVMLSAVMERVPSLSTCADWAVTVPFVPSGASASIRMPALEPVAWIAPPISTAAALTETLPFPVTSTPLPVCRRPPAETATFA